MPRPFRTTALASAVAMSASAAIAQSDTPVEQAEPNVAEFAPAFAEQTRAPALDSGVTVTVETLADGLSTPWGMDATPDGAILITERPGRLRVVVDGELLADPVVGLPEVAAEEQGGLLDVAVGPSFAEDRLIYWTYSKSVDGGLATVAARGALSEDFAEVTDVEDIFVQSPPSPSPMHYGSRLAFDGAGHVYVTTGEHFTDAERVLAQDLGASYGKVVRVTLDGGAPDDNPFAGEAEALPEVWSYGHRNIQSAAIHPESGALWVGEHGPQGGDEINLIEPGQNYGWPVISYGENYDGTPVGEGETVAEGMEQPRYYWDPVIAPGGMAFYAGEAFADWEGDLLIASLDPGAIVRLELDGDTVVGEERLFTGEGRIRDVAVAEDGAILVLTNTESGALLRLTPED